MKYLKTPSNQREQYVYRFYDGSKVVIEGGEAMDKWIKILHSLDDAEVYNNIKNNRVVDRQEEADRNDEPVGESDTKWSLSIDSLITDDFDKSICALKLAEPIEDSMCEMVREKVMELTDAYQELYRLYYIEGYSQEEIARIQNISQKNVCVKLGKLKKHLIRLCREKI